VVHFGLKPYQYSRITTFLNPEADPLGDGWNITQSLIAIGSGGLVGKGYMAPNSQNALGFLPHTIVHNDFIFSVMAEQHGFLGGIILVCIFAVLFLVMLSIALNAEDDLGRLLATGITMLLFTHTFMNLGMTISLTPITGLPLPLVSYGGSFVMITMMSFAIMQSIWIYRRTLR
jgi:rod shape determining protein RodA